MIITIPKGKLLYAECIHCQSLNHPNTPSPGTFLPDQLSTMDYWCPQCNVHDRVIYRELDRVTVTDSDWFFETNYQHYRHHWMGSSCPQDAYLVSSQTDPTKRPLQPKEVAEIVQHALARGAKIELTDSHGGLWEVVGAQGKTGVVAEEVQSRMSRKFNITKLPAAGVDKITISGVQLTATQVLTAVNLWVKFLR
jgi:hypothetical protein